MCLQVGIKNTVWISIALCLLSTSMLVRFGLAKIHMLYHYLHVGCNLPFRGWMVRSYAVVTGCRQGVLMWLYHIDVALGIGELVFKHRPNTIDLNGYLLVVEMGVILMVLRFVLMDLVLF